MRTASPLPSWTSLSYNAFTGLSKLLLGKRLLLHYRRNVLPFGRAVISLLNLLSILLVITTRDCNFLSCLHFIVNMQFPPILQSFHGIPLQHSFGSSYLISHILLLSASFIASSFQTFANTSNLNIPSTFLHFM